MRTSTPALALRQARLHLLEHGNCLPGTIDERLARSWQRSLAAGLQPVGRLVDAEHTSGCDLRHTLTCNHDLLAHSRPVMEFLFEQVRHNHSMVILADKRGMLMHTMGDPYFLDKAKRVALSCGASWHEAQRGTNAIGTAVAEAASVEIHGSEHFLERNGFLTCAAAPIMSASGELLGVLDISGEHRSSHPHTLGLVSTAARMIENSLMGAKCRDGIRLHLHAHPEGIGSVAEGIIALSFDGWVTGANRAALNLLPLTMKDLGATRLENVIDVRLDDLRSRHQRRPDQPIQVRLHDGSALFVRLHVDQLTLSGSAPSSSSAAGPALEDALSRLDAGDPRWRSATDKARRVMDKPIPLLLLGESGVGKELFARAVHESGLRRNGPFVAVNCSALPESLIESELFGYAPGAFTGARREGSPGRLREAHGGTLLLDEIGDMPLHMQSRLLRVLQERQVTPLGGSRAVDVDFALICATHRQLREEAETGKFRSDLYYRINGLTLQLPALRERTDFQPLTERVLASLHPEVDVHLAPDLLAALSRHSWPGNMRQYTNVLRTASAMLGPDEYCIDWQHLPDDIADELRSAEQMALPPIPGGPPQNLAELSRSAIRQALEDSRGNISQAARRLGISRQTLYRKLNA
jgi:sigma-54 dependent transcriptional regulator, acetoin dehydrogenase operon transcriptional activator AcoR